MTWQGELAFEGAVGMEAEKVSGTDVVGCLQSRGSSDFQEAMLSGW